MQGWIKLHRQMQENILWQDKPFSKGQAWIDLLLMANFAEGQMLSKGTVVTVKRGQVFRTQKFLAERWGWSIKKVRGFITLLENQKMVISKGIAQGTLISIENYGLFQDEGQAESSGEDILDGNSKAGKERQNKKKKTNKFIPPTMEEVKEYCKERKNNVNPEKYMAYYQSNGWKVGRNKMQDWKAAVRMWERNDNNETQTKPRRQF